MKQEILNRWVKALRSGEYKKCIGNLKSGNRHCVLGVLCDLHARETGNKWEGSCYLMDASSLPGEVVEWAGLPKKDPSLRHDGKRSTCITLNDCDEYKLSFKELATLLVKAQKEGLLGKVIRSRRKKRKAVKKDEAPIKRTVSGTGITGELECEQPEPQAALT